MGCTGSKSSMGYIDSKNSMGYICSTPSKNNHGRQSQAPSDWQSEKPSDWQWMQESMTSIPSAIKTSASARSTPILWKINNNTLISKRRKSSNIITIEFTTPPSPQRNDRSDVLHGKYIYELKRIQTKKNLSNNGMENYVKVLRVTA